MRGRLIFPFPVEIARLDTAGMVTNAEYDLDFREPIKTAPVSGQGPGTTKRRELALIRLPAQFGSDEQGRQQQTFDGNVPSNTITLVFHFRDLEAASLVDPANGDALIRVGDRLHAIYNRSGGLVQLMTPTVFAVSVQPSGYGLNLGNPNRNLLLVKFEDREKKVP